MSDIPTKILLVEDNPADARLLHETLRDINKNKYELTHIQSLGEAIVRLTETNFDAILLDLFLPDSQGLETVERILSAAPALPIIVLTGLKDESTGIQAVRKGAQDYLIKGQTNSDLLIRAINYSTERKRVEEELRKARDELEIRVQERTAELSKSEDRFRMMAETIPDVFWISTPQVDKILYVSPAYEKIWGRSPESLYKSPKSFMDAIHPEDVQRVVAALEGFTKRFWDLEYRIRQPDGSVRWIMDRGFPICDEKGNVILMTGVATDITELKLTENMLLDKTRKMDAFFRHTVTPLVFLDKEFNFIQVNEAYAKACQRDISEFAGNNHFEFYPNEENQHIFEQVVRTKTPYQTFAKPFSFPDRPEWGLTYWDWTLVPMLDETGEVEFLVFSLKDVTERVQAELALQEQEQYLRTVVSNAPIVLFATDEKGIITVSEGRGLEALGRKPGESVGMSVFEKYRDHTEIVKNIRRALKGESFVTEVEVLPDIIFETTYSPIIDENSDISGVIGTSVDITERKKAEKRILADQDQLRALTAEVMMVEERERRKIAMELHDSVGQILAFLKIELGDLQSSEVSKESIKAIQRLREQVEQAIKQTRTLTFEMSPPELYELGMVSAFEELTHRFSEERGLTCTVDYSDSYYPVTMQMKILLYRSVRELLINAAKHAQTESVQIIIRRVGGYVEITVEDNGVGFDTSHLNGTRHAESPGFGLLSISERVKQMGGKLDICSARGKGTKITLMAPLEHKVLYEGSKEK
jgi:PAS domain S-box-containing protein